MVAPSPRAAGPSEALILFLFVVLGVVLFAPILGSFFLADDFTLLEAVRKGGPLGAWWRGASFFRPLVSISLYVDHAVSGLRPFGFHLTNVLAHAGCAFLVYRVTAALPLDRLTALLAGIAFLTLPAHSEPVAWISGRTDVLAALGGLFALDCYLRFRLGGRRRLLLWALVLSFIGLCAKESVIPLCGIIFFADLLLVRPPSARPRRAHWLLGTLSFLAVASAYLLIRRAVLGKWIGGYGAAVHLNKDPMLLGANLMLYPLRTLLAQLPTAVFPPDIPTTGVQQAVAEVLRRSLPIAALRGLCVLVVLAAGGLGWLALRGARKRLSRPQALTLGFLVVATYLALLPVLNLSVSLLNSDGERFLYFPSAFAVMALVALLRFVLPTVFCQRMAFALLLLFYVVMLNYSNSHWRAAGRLSERLIAQLRREPAEPPLLLANLPDSIGGAFVFRNSHEAALRLFDPTPREVFVLTRHTLLHVEDEVAVTRAKGVLAVQLLEPRDYFYSITPPPPGTAVSGEYVVQTQGRTGCTLQLPQRSYALRFYSGGALHPVAMNAN